VDRAEARGSANAIGGHERDGGASHGLRLRRKIEPGVGVPAPSHLIGVARQQVTYRGAGLCADENGANALRAPCYPIATQQDTKW
jgi:hypothetical protein